MARAFDPGADAAVGLLSGEEVAEPPRRLVEDVGDAVAALGDGELRVGEVPGAQEVDGGEVADDAHVHGAAVVVAGVVPAAGERERLGVGVHHRGVDLEMRHLDAAVCRVGEAGAVFPVVGRIDAAPDLEVAGVVGPAREVGRLGAAAALVVEALHVERERLAEAGRPDVERLAAADARDAQEIAPRRRGREVYLARLLAAEGGAVARRVRRARRERP